jgi:hypothetical protein
MAEGKPKRGGKRSEVGSPKSDEKVKAEMLKEKEYLVALRSEMKADSAAYDKSLNLVYYMRPMLDSLFTNASNPDRYHYTLMSKWNEPVNERAVTFLPALAIIQQLKSSGNLRLIDKKEIGRKIIKYETYIEGVYKRYYNSITDASGRLYSIEDDICDYKDFSNSIDRAMLSKNFSVTDTSIYYDMPIKIRNVEKLNQLANSAVAYNGWNLGYIKVLTTAKQQSTEIIQLINKEYGASDE